MDEQAKFNWAVVSTFMAIVLAVLALMIVAVGGCSQVQMSPAYKQELIMSNIVVQSLNADCQAGDPNACKEGLAESAKILQLLVDAATGIDPNGGPLR